MTILGKGAIIFLENKTFFTFDHLDVFFLWHSTSVLLECCKLNSVASYIWRKQKVRRKTLLVALIR